MTFLAGLELSKQRAVTLRQARLFSELWILRRDLEAWAGEVSSDEGGAEEEEWTPSDRGGSGWDEADFPADPDGHMGLGDRKDKKREDGV